MLHSLFQQLEMSTKFQKLEEQLKSARFLGVDNCVQCGFCCFKRTCITTPDELEKIAEYLRLSMKDCIEKYYAIDTLDYTHYFIRPLGSNIVDLAGKFIPAERTFDEGKCIFLKRLNGKYYCKIDRVKPLTAKLFKCWQSSSKNIDVEKDAMQSWNREFLKTKFGISV